MGHQKVGTCRSQGLREGSSAVPGVHCTQTREDLEVNAHLSSCSDTQVVVARVHGGKASRISGESLLFFLVLTKGSRYLSSYRLTRFLSVALIAGINSVQNYGSSSN